MKNDSENLPGSTVEMAAAEFELPTDGNNNPEKQLDFENLELDTGSIDRLSVKPVQKYRFVRSIGRGGMKMVLQMKDLDATRDVAMAVLPEAPTRPKGDLIRFIQEARITASLEHPNIVPVHEIGIDSTGAPYYTMKLLRGGTLASLISKLAEGNEQFNAEYNTIRLLRIFLKICSGIAFAHSKGVIHLDLKPENIQVGDFGEVLIMDWGLAKVREHLNEPESPASDPPAQDCDCTLPGGTQDGIMKGTPGYMAPEQAAGKNSARDERTDIYSLGAILYSLMTWKDPLEEKTVRERIEATLTGKIIPPSLRAPEREIPAGVEAVIRKAMSLNPADRYQSVKELRNEVNAFIGGYATLAEKASIAKKTVLFFRRNLLISALLTIALFFGAVGSFYMFLQYNRDMTGWREIYTTDFRTEQDFQLHAPGNREKRNLRPGNDGGVLLNTGEWLWLDRAISGNLKLLVTCSAPADTELNVVFGAENLPLDRATGVPPGWMLRLNTKGGWDMISRSHTGRETHPLTVAGESSMTGKFSFVLVKEGNRIRVYKGTDDSGTPLLETTDLLPPSGPDRFSIGFCSLRAPVTLQEIKLHRQTVPDTPAPLIRPILLEEEGFFRQAFEEYLAIAQLYPNEIFADQALSHASRLASIQLADENRFRQRVGAVIEKTPAFTRKAEIATHDALFQWNRKNYRLALDAAEKILTEQPENPVLLQLLAMPRKDVPPDDALRLLNLLANSAAGKKMVWLDISGFNLERLGDIRKMKSLRWLDCSRNKLKDLSILNGMKLDFLDCSRNSTLNQESIPGSVKTVIR